MNVKERFRELRRALQATAGSARRKPISKPRQLELSLRAIRRARTAT